MEKSILTPDQYPLSLNALTNACNQKSSRDPVLTLDSGAVQHAVNDLVAAKHVMVQNFGSRVDKYQQRFCNTQFAAIQFTPAEFAVICLLLLRGAQTPGELRAHSGRLHEFADVAEVDKALESLLGRGDGPFVARLPREPKFCTITCFAATRSFTACCTAPASSASTGSRLDFWLHAFVSALSDRGY